jgi:hypothetical protein
MALERRLGQHLNDPKPDPVERQEQINKVWEMKRLGHTFAEIAEEMKCSTATAHKLFKEGRQQLAPPGAEEMRVLALMQMEENYAELTRLSDEVIDNPDLKLKLILARDKLLKSMRELMGTDAAIKYKQMVEVETEDDHEFADIVEAGKAHAERERNRVRRGGSRRRSAGRDA